MKYWTDVDILEKWFEKRFNRSPSQDPSYFDDWMRRLGTGNIGAYMDSKSLKLWNKMVKEHKKLNKVM